LHKKQKKFSKMFPSKKFTNLGFGHNAHKHFMCRPQVRLLRREHRGHRNGELMVGNCTAQLVQGDVVRPLTVPTQNGVVVFLKFLSLSMKQNTEHVTSQPGC
jgi:hypothetical protein